MTLAVGLLGISVIAVHGAESNRRSGARVHPSLPADFFPCGAMHMSTISHWQHYLPPVEEYAAYMDKDLARMKEVGLNSMAAHVDWYDIEPAPGEFNFARLDRLIDLVDKHGLRILLWPWPELQPEWVARQYPDGQWLSVTEFKPGPACWDHPEVRKLTDRFVRTVVNRYKDRPSVLAWDVGAEAGIWVSAATPVDRTAAADLYCYCPHTAGRYRDWLKQKYVTLAKLNEIWATYYKDWSEIQPVRVGAFERAQIYWLDWRQFMLWNTAEFQRIKAEAARACDPNRPITCHLGGWGWAYVHHGADEYQIGRHFDFVGLSFFPFWLERGQAYDSGIGGMMLDGVRSASGGKPMWVEELQGGPSIFGLNYRSRFPTPSDIRLWNWQCVAHGATGVFYWNWRPETTGIEAAGFGLVNYDGSLTDRARAAGEVAKELNRHANRLLSSKPVPAEVAILHDPRSFIQAFGEQDGGLYSASVRGAYRALYRANIPVDILVPEQLFEADLTRYKAIYLPFTYLLSREEGQWLAKYVEQGGYLFAATWCAQKDERTFLYETVPGAGLDELFGCREQSFQSVGQVSATFVDGRGLIGSLKAGVKLPAQRYTQKLELRPGAEVVAEFDDKSPAVIAARRGKGRVLYAAMPLFQAYDATSDSNSQKVILDVASAAGVEAPIRILAQPDSTEVIARVLAGSAGRTVVIINHSWTDKKVDVILPHAVKAKVFDLLSGNEGVMSADGVSARLSESIPARQVLVLAVDKVK
jgi:beta-galactosidase